MKIQNNITQNKQSFKGILNNKFFLKSLETVADHSASFIAATSFVMAAGVRPLAISISPKADKENKQYAATNSIASGIIKFGMAEAIAIPVENALLTIDKNPEKFLKSKTVKNLKSASDSIINSKNYKTATQIIKQSTNLITAIPKTMLTVALIPLIMDSLFSNKKEKTKKNDNYFNIYHQQSKIFDSITESQSSTSFKGGKSNIIANGVAKIINNKTFQKFIKKMNFDESNIARNMSVATDMLLTGSFALRTNNSKKIKEERKKPLIYNNIISTAISILLGCGLDNIIKNSSKGFIEKFSKANINNPKLSKYIEGINIIRPTMIFALIYYAILPIFSTTLSDAIDKHLNKNKANQQIYT